MLNFNREPDRRGGCVICGKPSNGVSMGVVVTKRQSNTKKTITVASKWNAVCELHAEELHMGVEEAFLKVVRQQKVRLD